MRTRSLLAVSAVLILASCGGGSSESSDTTYSTYAPSSPVETYPPVTDAPTTTVDEASLDIDRNACFNSLTIVQSNGAAIQMAIDNFDMFGNPYVSVFAKLNQQLLSIAQNASMRVSGEISAMAGLMGSLYESVLYQDDTGYDYDIQTSSRVSSDLLYACADVGASCPDGRDIASSGYSCE